MTHRHPNSRYDRDSLLLIWEQSEEWETGEPPRRTEHVFAEPMSSYAQSGDPEGLRYGHAEFRPNRWRRKVYEPLDDEIDAALIAQAFERQARFAKYD